MSAVALKRLNDFLAEYGIPRRTFYDLKNKNLAPRVTKIGRRVYVAAEDEAEWLQRHRSATAAVENRIVDLTVRLSETALELATKPTPEQSLDILHRAEGLAHQLIAARGERARLAGDEAADAKQNAEHERILEVNRDAWAAADRAIRAARALRHLAGA